MACRDCCNPDRRFIRSGYNTPLLRDVLLGEYLAVSAARKFIQDAYIGVPLNPPTLVFMVFWSMTP